MAEQKGRMEGIPGHIIQGKPGTKSTAGRKSASPKPAQRKTDPDTGGHRYGTPNLPKTSQNPGGIPQGQPVTQGILSSILRGPHPGIPRPQIVTSLEKPGQPIGGALSVHITQHRPVHSSGVSKVSPSGLSPRKDMSLSAQPGGLSPSRTPTTLPPKKSLSPSRMLYTEQKVTAPVSKPREPSPVSSQSSQRGPGQMFVAHPADIKAEGLFQQYKVKAVPSSLSNTEQMTKEQKLQMMALAEHTLQKAPRIPVRVERPNIPVSQSHPQPAHQHSQSRTPPPQVSTIRRTPSPAHFSVHGQQKGPHILQDQGQKAQAVNLSVAADKAKNWHSHAVMVQQHKQPLKPEPQWDSHDFQFGDLLQSIKRSHESAQSQFQRDLSPITPADSEPSPHFNLDASAHPTHSIAQMHGHYDKGHEGLVGRNPIPVPVSIPVPTGMSFTPVVLPTSQVLSGHALQKFGHLENRTVSPKPTVNISTAKYVSTVSSRSTSPKPVVNIPGSIQLPADVGNIKQPVVSLVRLPPTVESQRNNQEGKEFIGQRARYTPPPNVSLVQQAPPPNVTVTSSGHIPFQPQIQKARHSRNPFTFPATPPVSMTTDMGPLQAEKTEQTKSQIQISQDSSFDLVKQRHKSDEMPRLLPVSPVKPEIKREHGKTDSAPVLVEMPNPFNQRLLTLANFPNNAAYRPSYRATSVALHRAKAGCITSAAKSLDILRQNLQKDINKEIEAVIQKYLDKFFKKGVENIKLNNGENAVSEDHMQAVCRQILEEAKKMYTSDSGRRSITPTRDASDNVSDTGSSGRRSALGRRRHPSDTDSEASLRAQVFKRKKGRPHLTGRSTPSKQLKDQWRREGPKYDPERLTTSTQFVMGSRANKAMGFGATRGRLYMKHPDLFKYSGDQDDKQWLYENRFMPATGGKAYMLVLEDITELGETEEYRNSPGLTLHELNGFCVPQWMIDKMRGQMLSMRTDIPKQKHRSRSTTPSEASNLLHEEKDDGVSKDLPFSSFSNPKHENNTDLTQTVSPQGEDDIEFLSTAATDDPSAAMSPFNVTGGFDDGNSDLDGLDDDTALEPSFGLDK